MHIKKRHNSPCKTLIFSEYPVLKQKKTPSCHNAKIHFFSQGMKHFSKKKRNPHHIQGNSTIFTESERTNRIQD